MVVRASIMTLTLMLVCYKSLSVIWIQYESIVLLHVPISQLLRYIGVYFQHWLPAAVLVLAIALHISVMKRFMLGVGMQQLLQIFICLLTLVVMFITSIIMLTRTMISTSLSMLGWCGWCDQYAANVLVCRWFQSTTQWSECFKCWCCCW